MDNKELLSQPELMEWSGFKQKTGLIEWLVNSRIAFYFGKGGTVITTVSAINNPLIGQEAHDKKNKPRRRR